MIEDHLGVVDETGAAVERAHARLWELLDRDVLPCLERPGRQLGPYDVPLRATTGHSNVALIYPSLAEGVQAPAALRPLFEIVAPRRDIQPCLACAPAADLEQLLENRGLPLFGRPQWTPLADSSLWVVLLTEPLDLLGLLTVLRAARVEPRSAARAAAPTIVATGAGAMRAETLCRVFADAVVPFEHLDSSWFDRWIDATSSGLRGAPAVHAAGLGEGGTAGAVVAPVGRAATKATQAAEGPVAGPRHEEQAVLLARGSHGLRRPARVREGGRNTAFTERVWVGSASEALRARFGMLDGRALGAILAEVFATEAGTVALDLVWGLPGETAEDRAATAPLLDAVVDAAPRGVRQVRARIGWYVPTSRERASGASPLSIEEAERSLARLRDGLRARRLRVDTAAAGRAAIAALLEDAPADLAPVLESVHAAGARTADLGLACDAGLWRSALATYGRPDLGRSDELPIDRIGPPASHGLGKVAIPPAPRSASRARETSEPRVTSAGDRWKRWSSLAPQQFEIRVEYAKRGRARLLGPGELTDVFLDAVERAGLPLATTGVVDPRPRLSFGPSLPAGIVGEREVVDLGLVHPVPDLLARLAQALPAEIAPRAAAWLPPRSQELALGQVALAEYAVEVTGQQFIDPRARAESLERLHTWRRRIEAGRPCVDDPDDTLRQVHALDVEVGAGQAVALRFALDLRDPGPKCKPRDVLARGLTGLDVDVRCLPLRRLRLLMLVEDPIRVVSMTPLERVRLDERRQRARAKFSA